MRRRLNTIQCCDICHGPYILEFPTQKRCRGECAEQGLKLSIARSNANRDKRYREDPEYRERILKQAKENFQGRYWLEGLREKRMAERKRRRAGKGLTGSEQRGTIQIDNEEHGR